MQFIRRSYVDDFSSHVVVVVALRAEGGRAVGRSGGRAVGRSGSGALNHYFSMRSECFAFFKAG